MHRIRDRSMRPGCTMASRQSQDDGINRDKEKEKTDAIDFETVVRTTGYGRFNALLMLAGSVAMLSAGFENALNSYILTSAQCDLKITTEEMGYVYVLFLAGSISSAYFCGLLSDVYGRRLVMVVSLALNAFVLLVSSFSPSLMVLQGFRFISGFLSGIPASLIIPYVGEFHSDSNRNFSVCVIGFFWALSWMLTPGIAWLVIPYKSTTEIMSITFYSWRFFISLFAIPAATASLLLVILPESPRFLLAVGFTEQAHTILQKIFAYNTGKCRKEYPITLAQLFSATESLYEDVDSHVEKLRYDRSLKAVLRSMFRQTIELVRPPFLIYTCTSAGIMAAIMFGAYGLGFWLPEMIQRMGDHFMKFPNESLSICIEVLRKPLRPISSWVVTNLTHAANTSAAHNNCADNVDDSEMFKYTLIIGSACLVGDVLYGLLANKFSIKVVLGAPMLLVCACTIAIYFVSTTIQTIVIACAFQVGIEVAYLGIYTVVMDNFPTRMRGVAMCSIIMAGRVSAIIINLLFGEFYDALCAVPFLVTAGFMAVGFVLSLLVPSGKRTDIKIKKIEPKYRSKDHISDTEF